MLAALFSFEGRIGRLQYLGWSIAAMIVLAIVGTALAFAMAMSLASSMQGMTPDQIMHRPAFWVTAGIGIIVFAWPGFALAAKRLRDIGLPPLIWLSIFVAFCAMDHLLIAPFLHADMLKGTIAGGIVGWLSGLFLMLMPGNGGGDAKPDMSYLAPEIDRMRRQMRADYDGPVSQPTPRMPPLTASPQGFGRRR